MEQPLPNGHGSDEQPSGEQRFDGTSSGEQRSANTTFTVRRSGKTNSVRAVTVRERFPTFLKIHEIEEVGRIEIALDAIGGYQLVNGESARYQTEVHVYVTIRAKTYE